MNDVELAALTELVATERDEMQWANDDRQRKGHAPAYGEDMGEWPNRTKLEQELQRRGVAHTTESVEESRG